MAIDIQIFHTTFELVNILDILRSLVDSIHSFHVTDVVIYYQKGCINLRNAETTLPAFRVL